MMRWGTCCSTETTEVQVSTPAQLVTVRTKGCDPSGRLYVPPAAEGVRLSVIVVPPLLWDLHISTV